MEDRFKEMLEAALVREGMTPADLARDVGMDKAYFVDLLAGRKKTVSALPFMLSCRRMGIDPWEVSGLTSPDRPKKAPEREVAVRPSPPPPPVQTRVSVTLRIIEGAYRLPSVAVDLGSYPSLDGFPVEVQRVGVVDGSEYGSWGMWRGAILHMVVYGRYEAVAHPGRFVVCTQRHADLMASVIRRVGVDGSGMMTLEAPDGSVVPAEGAEFYGLVVSTTIPA